MEPPKEGGSFFFQRILQSGVCHGALRVLNRLKKAGHLFRANTKTEYSLSECAKHGKNSKRL